MRALTKAPDHASEDLRRQVREAFKKHSSERNAATIKSLLGEGKKQLVYARSFASPGEGLADTWVGTGEVWDVRGRVGKDWPWGGETSK